MCFHLTLRQVNLEFRKLGIHPSQLLCRIVEPPVRGQLRLNPSPGPDGLPEETQERILGIGADRTFSILDLWQGRVMYVHSGSEDQEDFFTFSIFSNNKNEMPIFLEESHLHRFNISITPVNDAPVLSLPQGNLFTLPEKSRRQVGKSECLYIELH